MTTGSSEAVKKQGPAAGNPAQTPGGPGIKKSGKSFQVLEFLLGKEHFAIDLFDVREVVEYTPITQLPNAASCMKVSLTSAEKLRPSWTSRTAFTFRQTGHGKWRTAVSLCLMRN